MAGAHSGLVRVCRRANKWTLARQRATSEVDARPFLVPACVSGECKHLGPLYSRLFHGISAAMQYAVNQPFTYRLLRAVTDPA